MRRKALFSALALVILIAALAGGLYWSWSNSPRYALQQMALALETRDMQKFFNYLDLKEIFNNMVEAANNDTPAVEDPQADEWTRFAHNLGRKFSRHIVPKILAGLENPIRGLMEKYLLNLDQKQIAGIAAAATMARIDTKGDEALVTLVDPKTRETMQLQMRRQPQRGTWQIVAVNYQDLKKLVRREFQQ